jgi:hypothetical protein
LGGWTQIIRQTPRMVIIGRAFFKILHTSL